MLGFEGIFTAIYNILPIKDSLYFTYFALFFVKADYHILF